MRREHPENGEVACGRLTSQHFGHALSVAPYHGAEGLDRQLHKKDSVDLVGSTAGAAILRKAPCQYPAFPLSCPVRSVRNSVSSSRHIARSMRISRTTRSCTVHFKGYETYPAGAAFGRRTR
jgi:hypothetical protein